VLKDLVHFVSALLLNTERFVKIAEGDVENGTIFRGVDVLAGKHVIAGLFNACFAYEREQIGEERLGDEVFGEVEEEGSGRVLGIGVGTRELVETSRVLSEEVLEDEVVALRVVGRLEFLPGRVFRCKRHG